MRFAAVRRRWRWAPPRPTEGFLLSVCECVCACPCMHWVRLWSGGAKGATEKPGHTTGPRVRQRNFFFSSSSPNKPRHNLKDGAPHQLPARQQVSGRGRRERKHDTSCLGNNGTTAPEGVGGDCFRVRYPGPVKQTTIRGERECPWEPRTKHLHKGHLLIALSTEKHFFCFIPGSTHTHRSDCSFA